MTGLPYTKPALDLSRAPKGKIPFVEDDGRFIGDSTLVIAHLEATRGVGLDTGLSDQQRAISLAFRRMLKENSYWGIIDVRYLNSDNWAHYREGLAALLAPDGPRESGLEAAEHFKQAMVEAMHLHGIGRHSEDERAAILRQDLRAVSDLLGDRQFMLGGDEPTTLDATVYGYVGSFISPPLTDPLSAFARSLTNLVQLCDRIGQRLFPELARD